MSVVSCQRPRGFSVAESVIAATVLGLTVVFLLTLLPSGLLSLKRANQRTQAAGLAESLLAEYSLKDLTTLPLGEQALATPSLKIESTEYRQKITVTIPPSLPQARLLRAEVSFRHSELDHLIVRQTVVSLINR